MRFDEPSFYAGDPYPTYARLRAEDPVHWSEENQLWALSRHADVVAVSRSPDDFCSGRGVLMEDRKRGASADLSILYLDPPEHQRRRKLVNPGFNARRLAQLEDFVRDQSRQLLDQVAADTTIDAVEELAVPLPLLVIAELLAIPPADRDRFKVWSDAMIEAADHAEDHRVTSLAELLAYFDEVVAARRQSPGDDLISMVLPQLDSHDLLMFCMTVLVAGNETTRNLISGGLLALAEQPDERARLVSDRSLVPLAVEELLRWVTPVLSFARTATRTVELGGQKIAEGEYVLMLYGSANRDEDAFGPTADRLDVGRRPNPHVSFGFAEHFCLGAGLARLEARVFLEELLDRFSSWDVTSDAEWLASTLMHSLVRLPLAFAR